MICNFRLFGNTFVFLFLCALASSCSTPGPAGLFGKKSPHEQYGNRITAAGLKETALGRLWFEAARQGIANPVNVTIPYSETGYFPAEKPSSSSVRFIAKRGQKLLVNLTKKPAEGFLIFLDLWQPSNTVNSDPKLLASPDSTTASFEYEVREDGSYILRLQPELLKSGEYTLSVSAGPSLAFPVAPEVKSNMASFWGAGRDAGARKHEGIDIFAPHRTPLVAAANGVVTRVNENTLGGKVVWLQPAGKDYLLYYAHLDEQLVQEGTEVKVGDTLGLMGNTGNAKGGPSHLHFGIYTNQGAIDPLEFINPVIKKPAKITAPLSHLGKLLRTNKAAKIYAEPSASAGFVSADANTLLQAEAATAGWYKVVLPDGQRGFINSSATSALSAPLRSIKVSAPQPLLEAPVANAARKTTVPAGNTIKVLAAYKDYYFISNTYDSEGWLLKNGL
jgi:murein DD-endopeptidase MepM/ murein hydrolase activator NlpD